MRNIADVEKVVAAIHPEIVGEPMTVAQASARVSASRRRVAPSATLPTKTMSLAQASRRAGKRKSAEPPGTYSHWLTKVDRGKGFKAHGEWRHNLTTDTAAGYTNRRDWQSKAMGMGPSATFATATGAATASSATSLTNSGAAFTTAGQGLAGQIVVCWISTTVMVYGIIVANTATVLTVDQWYSATSTTGAAGTTPASTAPYIVLPGQGSASWMAVTGGTTPTSASTTLNAEITTVDLARAVGTYAHTAAATTYTLVHLWTATTTDTINAEAQFGAANTTGGGVMPFGSAEPTPPSLISGDTLQNTVTITIN